MTLRLPIVEELRQRYLRTREERTLHAVVGRNDTGRWEVLVRFHGVPVRNTVHETFQGALRDAVEVTGRRP